MKRSTTVEVSLFALFIGVVCLLGVGCATEPVFYPQTYVDEVKQPSRARGTEIALVTRNMGAEREHFINNTLFFQAQQVFDDVVFVARDEQAGERARVVVEEVASAEEHTFFGATYTARIRGYVQNAGGEKTPIAVAHAALAELPTTAQVEYWSAISAFIVAVPMALLLGAGLFPFWAGNRLMDDFRLHAYATTQSGIDRAWSGAVTLFLTEASHHVAKKGAAEQASRSSTPRSAERG